MIGRHVVALAIVCAIAQSASLSIAQPSATSTAEGFCAAPAPIEVAERPGFPRLQAGQLVIQATWDASFTMQAGWQAVAQQAIAEWQATLLDNGCTANPLPIHFRAGPLGGALARCQPYSSTATNCIVRDTITIDPSFNWFVDSTPGDDSEFGTSPPAGFDLLTTLRHEIGHGVGWTETSRVTPLMVGDDFDPTRMNIPIVTATGFHVDPAWLGNELMTPTVGQSVRRAISLYPGASMIVRAFGGDVPMRYVDPNSGGSSTGSATAPWPTFTAAIAGTPAGVPILMAPNIHHVPINYSTDALHLVQAARGGATIVAP